MARLGDLGQIITGNTPKTADAENYGSKDIAFIKPSDIQEDKLTMLSEAEFYISEYARESARILPPGCVLVTCIGIVGKVAINTIECAFNQQINAIIPDTKRCDTKYVAYAIQSQQHRLQDIANAAVVPILNKTQFSDIEISLPSLEEQHRIAALLDKVSDLIAKRRAQLDKLDLLVKARFVEMFGDPETNTKHWPVLPMSQVCSVGSSKRIYQSEQSSEGVPFWRVSNLTDLINTGIATTDLYIPEERYNELKAQGQVPTAGDILLTSRGTLGQCYIVKENDVFYFQDGMISWLSKYSKSITPLYISYLFAMPGFRKQIESMQAGTTVSYLSIAMIKRLNVMIPPMEIQNEFNDFVRQVDKLKLMIQQSLDKLEILKKALMQQYFE